MKKINSFFLLIPYRLFYKVSLALGSLIILSLFLTVSLAFPSISYALFLILIVEALFLFAGTILILSPLVFFPIQRLLRAVKQHELISDRYFTNDEIGEIMKSCQEMILNLSYHQSESEKNVLERTQDLLKAYSKLQVLDKAKESFISLISHEMNTPLTIIKSSLFSFQENILTSPDQRKKVIEMGLKSTRRLEKLSALSTDIAMLISERKIFDKQRFSLNPLLDKAAENAAELGKERNIEFQYSRLQKPVDIMGDKTRFKKVIEYIVENALQYSSEAAKIIFSTEIKEQNVIIRIQDFGMGISDDKKELIFQPFLEKEDILSHSKGLGLSLYWSQKIIEAHGGTLSFESKVGQGTTFYVQLPYDI